MLKRILVLLLCLLLALPVLAAAEDGETALLDHALALASAMEELAGSPDYLSLFFGSNPELYSFCQGLVSAASPRTALMYEASSDALLLMLGAQLPSVMQLPPNALRSLSDKLFLSMPVSVQSTLGSCAVTVCSTLSLSQAVPSLLPDGYRLIVLEYDEGAPVVVCAIIRGGAASMTGTFLPKALELLLENGSILYGTDPVRIDLADSQ